MKFNSKNFFFFLIYFIAISEVSPLRLRLDSLKKKKNKPEISELITPKSLYEGWFRISSAGAQILFCLNIFWKVIFA